MAEPSGPTECALCGKGGMDESDWCFGCDHYVCDDCSVGVTWGRHPLEAHMEDDFDGVEEEDL